MSPSRHSVRAGDFLLAVFAFADPHHAETVSHTDWIQQSPKPMDVRVGVLSSYTDVLLTASSGKGNSLVRHRPRRVLYRTGDTSFWEHIGKMLSCDD